MKAELEKLIPITREEKGCIQYDLHQNNEDPAHFLFYENWESRELWQDHMNNQHLKEYVAATEAEDVVEAFTIFEMTLLASRDSISMDTLVMRFLNPILFSLCIPLCIFFGLHSQMVAQQPTLSVLCELESRPGNPAVWPG